MSDPVTLSVLAKIAAEKAAGLMGKDVARRFLPRTNDEKIAAEVNEQMQSVILRVEQQQDQLPEFIAGVVREELHAALRPALEQLEFLKNEGRLDAASRVMIIDLFDQFSEQMKKAHGDAKREALTNALVRQFDAEAGNRGLRNVWWEKLKELQDFEVEALLFLSDGSVIFNRTERRFYHGSASEVDFGRGGTNPSARPIALDGEKVENLVSALNHTVNKHGADHRGRFPFAAALLQGLEPQAFPQWIEYSLLPEGKSLVRFAARVQTKTKA